MMKKLFFFKSSTSSNELNNLAQSPSREKQAHSSGDGLQGGRESKSKKEPFLRRSRSYSSGTFPDSGLLRSQSDFPCSSSSNISQKHPSSRSSRRDLTPERSSRSRRFQDAAQRSEFDFVEDEGRFTHQVSLNDHIHPEYDLDDFKADPNFFQNEKRYASFSAGVDNHSSETSSLCSNKVLDRYIDGEQHQERSSRQINTNTRSQPNDSRQKPPRFQYAAPTSPTDSSLSRKPRAHSFREPSRESKQYMSTRDWVNNAVTHDSPRRRAKQVIEKLSQPRALTQVDLKDLDHDIPITLEDIYSGSKSFNDTNCRIDDDFTTRVLDYEETEDVDDITSLKAELHFRTRKLEKEKSDLQLTLEKELDRRSTDWSMKLEKYKTEEHRLRERVRELAEQNVSLQREVSMLGEKELDNQSKAVHSGHQVEDLTMKMEEVVKEKQSLHQNILELEEKYRAAEEDRDLFKRNFEAKDKECKELHKAVTRLLRTSTEQDKTIEGLRESFDKEMRNIGPDQQSKLQIEQLRLTGVEQSLRKELDSYRLEVDSLRHENINLLNRLKGSSGNGCFSSFKLDQELWSRVHCLQNQGICLINDSVQLCSKLTESVKERDLQNGLDSQFIMESEMKVQGFKRRADNLTRSLQNVFDVLKEKSTADNDCSEGAVISDFKAEALMTSLLREKLYSKEADVERLEAELSTAVRGNDVLRCEVENAMDNLSCVMHKMKDLEVQAIKKDENIYHLQSTLQDCKKELSVVNGILPKVSEERDMLWENVKQYSENNMLLSSEVGMLKKKVEALDEDVLMKEGQITILKDALGKPFDLLSSPNYM